MKKIKIAIQWVKLLAAVVFTMFAGAASYHQILMAQHPEKETIHITTVAAEPESEEKIEEIKQEEAPEMTEEEIQEEMYFDDLELLAACVEAEAGNQGLEGKRLVADVILNRVDDEDFPDTIEGVITQPYQFTTYWNGAMEKVSISEETFEACRMELAERGYPGIFYFTAGGYGEYGTPWRKVGDHYFCTK